MTGKTFNFEKFKRKYENEKFKRKYDRVQDRVTACRNNATSLVLEINQPKQIFQLIFCDLNQLLLSLENWITKSTIAASWPLTFLDQQKFGILLESLFWEFSNVYFRACSFDYFFFTCANTSDEGWFEPQMSPIQ